MTVSRVDFQGKPPFHTNHFLGHHPASYTPEEDPSYPSSIARYSIGRGLLEAFPTEAGVTELKSLFRDASHRDYPICTPYSDFMGLQVGTVSSVVMDLPNRTAHISVGNPSKSDFHVYKLSILKI